MAVRILNDKIVKRWDSVMYDICAEHVTINTSFSELEDQKRSYGVEDGVTVQWLLDEATYWLSCYYESGHCRCDDRFYGEFEYKTWVSETRRLKRLIQYLQKNIDVGYVAIWYKKEN